MRLKKLFLLSFYLLFFNSLQAQLDPFNYSFQKSAIAKKGAVVSAHALASDAGLQMLKQGGNAIDAAIATQLALAVVYPGAGNLGGGGFMVAHLKNGQSIALDYRETAPAKAGKDMYLDSNGNAVTEWSQLGHLASGTPGTVAGLFAAHKYAKLPFKRLIAPAIELAEKGFAVSEREASSLNEAREDFLRFNKFKTAFTKDADWKAGDILVQKDLANTLKRMRDFGEKGFYEGETAKLIEQNMYRNGGIITLNDLKNYKAKKRTAINFFYKGYQVLTMPLPSSGGIILQQMMGMVEEKNIASLKFQTAASVQLMVEAERRAFADRAEFLGDADFVKVPVKTLTSKKYLAEQMLDFVPGQAGRSSYVGPGIIAEHEETTHISIIDKEGNAVAVTTTLNGGYGSRVVIEGAGFLMNNEMDDFSIKPGVPNMYGAIGNAANAIAPGKRMLSSMTPTIVLKNKKPYIVAGTPGGTTIPTSVFQTLINLLEFGMKAPEAVYLPKFHHQWLPDKVFIEAGFNAAAEKKLETMGYMLEKRGPIGRTELILIKNGIIHAVADNRGDDDARAF
ncbi:MAG: gamma-glutamyltransferase [Ferruginibacter sp.]